MLTWLNGTPTQAPIFLEFRSNKYFIVLVVSAAVFTDIFLYGIVVPVLPFALTSRVGIAPDKVQTWISILLAVYGAALLAASPVCGHFADRTKSRRMPLVIGLLALAGATVLLTVGSSIAVLVLGRILQGFSAAVVWVVGLALLVDTVGPNEIGECMGYVGLAMSMAILLAPLLGGVVFEKAGYNAVFAMAFGLLGVDIALRLVLIEKKIAVRWLPEVIKENKARADEADKAEAHGQEMEVLPTSSVEAADTAEMGDGKDTTTTKDIENQDQAICSGHDNKVQEPTTNETPDIDDSSRTASTQRKWITQLPTLLYLLSSRRLCAALWGCLIQASLLTSFDSTLPLFVRDKFGWNSIGAGLIFLPLVLPSLVGPLIGWAADKYGPRWLATSGFVASVPLLILLRLVTHNSMSQKILLCALLCLLGFTLNLVLVPLMAEVTYAVEATTAKRPKGFLGDKGAYAQAYGLFNMAFAGGCLVGPLVGGLVNQRAGWGATTLVLGCLSAFSAVPTVVWTGGSIMKKRRKRREARVGES